MEAVRVTSNINIGKLFSRPPNVTHNYEVKISDLFAYISVMQSNLKFLF